MRTSYGRLPRSFMGSAACLLLSLLILPEPGRATGAQNQATATTPLARQLEPGKPIEREMKGGESHAYELSLSAGQFLDVVVEQKGVDVIVLVIGPDGKELFEVNSPTGTKGEEPVSLVSQTAGTYRLQVRAREADVATGKYEIKVKALRAATESDRATSEALLLINQSEKLRHAGEYDGALLLMERAVTLREKALGPEHPKVGASLNDLASLYQHKGDYARAESLFLRALAVKEKALGPDHPSVAVTVNNLAVLYQAKGELSKAEPLFQRALLTREKTLSPDHPEVANALSNMANLYLAKGEYGRVEALLERALRIYERAFGPDHPDVAVAVNNLAALYQDKGEYGRAEPLFERALAIRQRALGPDHPDVAESLNNLAMIYHFKGEYGRVEALLERALRIYEKALGPEHPEVATVLNNLAEFYDAKGEYAKAEPLLHRVLGIYEKALGPDHPDLANSLGNLGAIYRAQGDLSKAETLYRRSLTIREKALGPEHPEVADSLNNLAEFYWYKGEPAKAEPLYRRAITVMEKALGADHPKVAAALGNLGLLYDAKGEYSKAEPLYERALAIRQRALGPDHPDLAGSLLNLGLLYDKTQKAAEAEPLLRRSSAIIERALGPDHPWEALALNGLGEHYERLGDYAKAVEMRSRAASVSEHNIRLNLGTGSGQQKQLYLATLAYETDCMLTLHLALAPHDLAATRLALTTILRRKGRALDAMAESIAALRSRLNPQQQALLDKLSATRAQLASMNLRGPGKKTPQEHQAEVKGLEEQAEKFEDQISRQSAEFRVQSQPVGIENVQSLIPADAALVEYVSYRPLNLKTYKFEARRYAAYVLSRQGQPAAVDLGNAERIDADINALRAALRRKADGSLSDIKRELKPKARSLDEEVMQPVRGLLGDKRKLLIAPDGALNLLPFAALVDEKNQYLVKHYSISYLTSGRDLLRLQVKIPSRRAAAIVADPDFNATATGQTAAADTRLAQRVNPDADTPLPGKEKSPGPQIGGLQFRALNRLPSTGDEARQVQKSLPGSALLTDEMATEEAVKALSGPAILHVATHGFFLDDQAISPETRLLVRVEAVGSAGALAPSRLENPLLRSGLFFAGANTWGAGGQDDGVLTALEASSLNLWGTRLVVLSACDTGLGDVKNGEGVYGLRRALVLAGSETQMMSLWAVSDKGTSELMIDYYKRLEGGEGRSEALRDVQLHMLRHARRQHPYYWASFIQSGEWANLDGKR